MRCGPGHRCIDVSRGETESVLAIMAAAAAVAALTASEPVPLQPPEIQILAERVINCTNNSNVDSRLIAEALPS